ncbi:MAG: hypothetical protein ACO3M3_07510, partial [Flavobacteriaceae bacterium]
MKLLRVFLFVFVMQSTWVWSQLPVESNQKPKLTLPPPEKKGPSLLQLETKKGFFSEDFFNPKIEFKD